MSATYCFHWGVKTQNSFKNYFLIYSMIKKYREIFKVLQDLGYGDKAKIVDIVPEIVFCWLCNDGHLEAAKMLYNLGLELEDDGYDVTYSFENDHDDVNAWLDTIFKEDWRPKTAEYWSEFFGDSNSDCETDTQNKSESESISDGKSDCDTDSDSDSSSDDVVFEDEVWHIAGKNI